MRRFTKGVLFTLAGACLWGFSGGCAQYLFEHYDTSAMFLTAVRLPAAGLMFILFSLVTQRDRLVRLLHSPESLRGIALFGIVGLFLSQVTYLAAVDYTNAGTATVLQQVCCVLTMLWTCLSTRRAPRAGQLLALVCAMAATFLIATGGDPSSLSLPIQGVIMGLLSALTVAFYLVQPQGLMAKWGSLPVTGLGMLFGAVPAAVVFAALPLVGAPAEWTSVPALDAMGWLMLASFVVVGTFAAYAFFLTGVSMVGGVVGGLLGCAEPVSASLFSMLWLGTAYGWADWAGLVLMLATIVLVTVKPKPVDA